ncbi:DUF6397 family protein [Streptomyces sp. NPDC017936]|uniref:DUF6397 family protein n=1 Tax=Streptomyces sp. NPDC017936 TaxID=3365016 RepID=UPI00378EEF35
MSRDTTAPPRSPVCTFSRAAKELGLKRSEFDLAVNLGRIRTVPDEGGGGRRVARLELDRLRAARDFPEALRDSVETVGTVDGAALVGVPPTRFTRLARLGLVVPVKFHVNRYRAVVWLYLAEELRQFAAGEDNAPLLTGRTPTAMREQLAEGLDLRSRNWRGRHLGFLLRQADGPWQRAGALASFLDPLQVAELVQDPYERSHLNRFRAGPPVPGVPGSPAARLVEEITTAADADEIARLRSDLLQALDEARAHQPAPRPAPKPQRGPAPVPEPPPDRVPARPAAKPRPSDRPERAGSGLLGRLRRGNVWRRVLRRSRRGTGPAPSRRGPDRAPSYSARKSPSWTTDTSRRPWRS